MTFSILIAMGLIATLSVIMFSIVKLSIRTFNTVALSTTIFSIMTLSIMGLIMTVGKMTLSIMMPRIKGLIVTKN